MREMRNSVGFKNHRIQERIDHQRKYGSRLFRIRDFHRILRTALSLTQPYCYQPKRRHTLGSTGIYCLGMNKGMTTATTVKIPSFTHRIGPSAASAGPSEYVARGQKFRYAYTPKVVSRTRLLCRVISRFQLPGSRDSVARDELYHCNSL